MFLVMFKLGMLMVPQVDAMPLEPGGQMSHVMAFLGPKLQELFLEVFVESSLIGLSRTLGLGVMMHTQAPGFG